MTLNRQAGENPGNYEIQVRAEASSNYALTCQNGIFTIRDGKLEPSMVNNLNAGLGISWKGKRLTVKWGKVSIADGYDIFASECTKNYPEKPTATVKNAAKNQVKLTKISGKKLKSTKAYKMIVKPFRMVDGKKEYIAASYSVHRAGKDNRKLTNVKKIKVKMTVK